MSNYPPRSGVPARRQAFQGQQFEAPRGAQAGAIGQPQQVPVQFNQPQYAQPQAPQGYWPQGYMPQGQGGYMAPMGADAGVMAGCAGGPGMAGCGGPIMSPFAGMAVASDPNSMWLQRYSLLGIIVTPTSAAATTLEVACGGTLFHGCGGRAFNEPNTYAFTEIVSGPNSLNRICPGANVDVSYFNTDECFCPFDFGCFSNSAPLVLTFVPITTLSTFPPFNFLVVGEKLESFGCPWYGFGPYGYPGGGQIPGGYGAGGMLPPGVAPVG
jgi:hypothetical protein